MNTIAFVFGQLLTLEMLAAGRQPSWQRFQRRYRSSQGKKEFFMDNSILVIAFLIVSLIANFTLPTNNEDRSGS